MDGASDTQRGAPGDTSEAGEKLTRLAAENERLSAALAERDEQLAALEARGLVDTQIRIVADSLPVLISYVDAEGRYRYNNRAYEAWFGIKRKEMFGRHLSEVFGEAAYEQARPLIERALAGERVSADVALPYREGGERFVHLDYVPDRRPDGQVAGFFALVNDISEAKRIEQTLRDSEARFRAMADCAPIPVWVTNESGIDFVSRAFEELAGRSADELTGEYWMGMIHPDDLAGVLSTRDEAWKSGSAYSYEARFNLPQGQRWMHVSSSPRLDEAGVLIGFVGMAIDITDQRLAEKELRESEARFRAIADSAPALIWVTDQGGVVFANRALVDFTGVSHDELLGPAWMSFAHPEDLDAILERRAEAWAGHEPYRFEARFRRADGEWRWLRARCEPRESGEGFIGYVGLAVDVTEERRAADELRRSEAHLSALVDQTAAGVAETDLEGRFTSVNARFCTMLAREREAILGRKISELIHPDDRARQAESFGAMVETGRSYGIEKRFMRPDGTEVWVNDAVNLIRPDSGSAAGALIVSIDITDRKRAEAALRELNQTLESRIAAAIAEREHVEEALRQAQKMEAVGQLTGGIAHDFNNLLTVIAGNLDLAARRLGGGGDPAIRRAIDSAIGGAERAATLTQRLLAFSRRQPLAPRQVEVNALIEGMSDLLRRTLGETIRVETRLADGLWPVEADPHQLESALLNLAVNGRDAMPSGGQLTIETGRAGLGAGESEGGEEVVPGDYVEIAVSDTGFGMDSDTVKRAVEPFFTTKEAGKGTGLGLSMVYGFVRQSGGHVRIESLEGEGTKVAIYLPRAGAAESGEAAS